MAFLAIALLVIQIVTEYFDSWFIYLRDKKKDDEFFRKLDEWNNKKP